MKRLHIHVSVENLSQSISFYSTLFAAEPSVQKDDYAKWMLDNPLVNFAISQRSSTIGLSHIGIQVDSADELAEMNTRLQSLPTNIATEDNTSCCYAHSNKHWVTDPTGLAWEVFHTLEATPTFGQEPAGQSAAVCCSPNSSSPQTASACCTPSKTGACC